MKIDELDISIRTRNCLKNCGLETTERLEQYTGKELLHTLPNFGNACLFDLEAGLKKVGVFLKKPPPPPSPATTTREWVAATLLSGMILRDAVYEDDQMRTLVTQAIRLTDELLKRLGEETKR